MKLINWSYTKRYRVKAVFDEFPDTVFVFRQIGTFYFVFTSTGVSKYIYPTRKQYVHMELLINRELGLLEAYMTRSNQKERVWIDEMVHEL